MECMHDLPHVCVCVDIFGTANMFGIGNGKEFSAMSLKSLSGGMGGGGGSQQVSHGARIAAGAASENTEDDMAERARAVKKARLVWTPQLHKRFEEALIKLGPEKAIPKNIMAVCGVSFLIQWCSLQRSLSNASSMQEMNVDGLTRENVASHLQKFRLTRKGGPDDMAFNHSQEKASHSAGASMPSHRPPNDGAHLADQAARHQGSGEPR